MHVKIDLKICIVIIIFIITEQLKIYGLFMLFACIHELGHLITGVILGFRVRLFQIKPYGVSIEFYLNEDNYKVNKKYKLLVKNIVIASMGPIVNFVIALFFIRWNISSKYIDSQNLVYINLLIGLFNLIPIYPLDGGRILKSLLHIKLDLIRTYKYINEISNIVIRIFTILASIFVLYYKNISIIIILIYLWYIVIVQNRSYIYRMRAYNAIKQIDCYNSQL
ncbi:MAG: hypothetical protein E7313_05755 [Clostridiales bacterium]|nr:hypothetical protein [Clostridiales bacterium]